jgi:acetyltransferase-like isoleucine patch superfamily enzyme
MILLKLLEKAYGISNGRFRRIILRIVREFEDGYFYDQTSTNIYKKYHDIEIGYGTGGFIDLPIIANGTVFGNYCSISENTHIFNANHPPKYFTTHALLFNPQFGCTTEDVLPRTKLVVGHDVWIGLNAIILPSVNSIGNGAIIAAGSVVTKNVESYAIMGGNPAKMIRSRFTPDVIEKLEQSKWWLLNKEDLIKNKEKFEKIVNYSIDDLKRERAAARLSDNSGV